MIFLMYHELEVANRPLCQAEPGYVRYAVRAESFRAQMRVIQDRGWRGLSVSDALKFPPNTVALTFDDGCETDLAIAAPILKEFGFGATFYVTAGFLDKTGYLSSAQLRELSELGFEIGCHSMTHAYLSRLAQKALHHEIVDSKLELEQNTGRAVEHFSFPGGRYDQAAIQTIRNADYRSASTSRIYENFEDSDFFSLGRIAVMRRTKSPNFEAFCDGKGLLRLNLYESLRRVTKNVLGNTLYDRVRGALLDDSIGRQ